MLKYLNQNKNVILVAIALFIVSVSTVLFFLGANPQAGHDEIKADLLDGADEKPVRRNEGYYRKLLNNNEDAILVLALDGSIEFISGDAESKWGYNKKDITQQSFFILLHPDDLPDFLGVFGKVLQTEQVVNTIGPYRIMSENGGYQVIIGAAAPLMEKGKVHQIAIAAKDITNEFSEKKVKNDIKQNKNRPGKKNKIQPPSEENQSVQDKIQEPGDGRIIADR